VENTVKMKKFYALFFAFFVIIVTLIMPQIGFSQACSGLTATYSTTESRCAATGTVQINAIDGSGSYQYKVTGPVSTSYTSVSLITGLSAGRYLVTIKDIVNNCIFNNDSITIAGNYSAPGFTLVPTGVTCINGNDGKITATGQTNGRAPFSYKIIAPSAMGVGTINASGFFTGLISGNYLIQLRDSCGAIQTRNVTVDNYNWSINYYNFNKVGCDSILFALNLTDSRGNVTPSPVFNGFMYGASIIPGDTTWFTTNTFTYYKGKKRNVQLFVKDVCGNIKSVLWTDNAMPNVNATVSIGNKVCATFRAKITGQVNLTSPSYCIYNSSNVLLSCNTNGTFTLLPYGSYCIKITDACYDTTIIRCFTVAKPVPSVDVNVDIVKTCTSFTATVTGQTNINNPNYCLYNASNILIICNTTGVFADLPFGTYCIKVTNDPVCYDTVITRCFTVTKPKPSLSPIVDISNLSCSTFTAAIIDAADWVDPDFCLYTPAHVLIICNTTGIFDGLPYDTYCIEVKNNPACYDTTIIRCFTVAKPIPSADDWVSTSNKTCTSFTAEITGQNNISNPRYCLYNSLNVLVNCNATGIFTNLPYGNYCIKIKNDAACYDTIIERCFAEAVTPVYISLSAKKSCAAISTTDLKVNFDSGNPAYTVSLFSPSGVLLRSAVTSATSYTFLSVPNLIIPQKYKIVVTDLCGNKDSALILPKVNTLSRVITVAPKCPSGAWPNGSGDVVVNLSANNIGGSITPKIIKKDGAVVAIGPTLSTSSYIYTFSNLAPGTYIFDTYVQTCNLHFYDTVTVRIYLYPILSGSNAYQCDNNGFSVNVNVQGGVAPYMYEIIGSTPASPSIITVPQASPVFNVNNGTAYSLIRLRVVDGCGNAGLYDVSVLPLANFIITANSAECFNNSLILRVDSIANAVYTWYKRVLPNDSIIIGSGPTYQIPVLLPSDTGRYFCRVVVNNGCLIKQANYTVMGQCYTILPNNDIVLAGQKQGGYNKLNWNKGSDKVKEYSLQRSQDNGVYQSIDNIVNNGLAFYSFADKNPFNGNNYYRIKLINTDNTVKYSNTILIKNTGLDIVFYPNPVNSILYISIASGASKSYLVEINNIMGQKITSQVFNKIQNAVINYPRSLVIAPGVYTVTITDLLNNEKQTRKLIYR
jgi:hypothetical protein